MYSWEKPYKNAEKTVLGPVRTAGYAKLLSKQIYGYFGFHISQEWTDALFVNTV
jgi:hypothetical protein